MLLNLNVDCEIYRTFFFLFQWRYSPGWASASFKNFLHPFWFRVSTVQFLHPRSSFATSKFIPSPLFFIPCPAQLSSFQQSDFSSSSFRNKNFFPRSKSQSYAQPPNWRTRVPHLVWPLPFDLSAKVDPTSSYATGSIALRVIGVLELTYHDKVEAPTGEFTLSSLDIHLDYYVIFHGTNIIFI